jgi:fructokinase
MGKDYIVGLGEILWDMFPEGKALGGAPANFAYHVGQLGLDSLAISAIGDDLSGDEIVSILDDKGLDHLVEKTAYPTGTVRVTLDGQGIPSYEIVRNVAWDNIPFTARIEEVARNCRAVCFGSLAQRSRGSREAIGRFLEAMPARSLKIFDINLRQDFYSNEVIESSLRAADILKINDDELAVLSDMFSIKGSDKEVCTGIMDTWRLNGIILTKGTEGSVVVMDTGAISFMSTPLVEVADTVGAGDAFTAAFTVAHLAGCPTEEAHALAVEISAYVCTRRGAMPPLPDRYKNMFGRR